MLNAQRLGLTPELVRDLVATASHAPSLHNTQPWRWRLVDDVLELRVDPTRRLRISDPTGRELVISCGAALFTLGLAVRRLGLEPQIWTLPDRSDPDLLAQVVVLAGGPPTPEELRLLAVVTRRHTHRGPFTDTAPDPGLLDELHLAARSEGARLAIVRDRTRADRIIDLAWQAETELGGDLSWQAEMLGWSAPPGSDRTDGVPGEAFPAYPRHRVPRQLPGRDFALGRGWGTGPTPKPGASVLAVLLTGADSRPDWLRAGRALQHVLLAAATDWVFAAFATQPLELPETRLVVQESCELAGVPQMVFQLGHATVAGETPRRPVGDVLRIE